MSCDVRQRRFVVALAATAGLWMAVAGTHAADVDRAGTDTVRLSIRVDLGKDVGQNFGTLVEVRDATGHVVAGAGFLGDCNTQSRSDRRLLHIYGPVRGTAAFKPEPLPRINGDAGTYLFEFDNRLFARGRGRGIDGLLRAWDPANRQWEVDTNTIPFSIDVASKVLATSPRGATYDGRDILRIDVGEGSVGETYYANGQFIFRQYDATATPPLNRLVACPWSPGQGAAEWPVDQRQTVPLRTAREFVYAFGQLREQVVAATNTGGLYVFDGDNWRTVLEPDVTVSFQIYSMLNYHDILLMGQYPTGELFAYDGRTLQRRAGWPPVMPGVSHHAREAQTLTLYGGRLYVGVWPWGEVWRLDAGGQVWSLEGRMFTHPQPTAATTHPYENETTAIDPVLNRWGQRVTSMVPWGDSLYIATSAKASTPYEPKFRFLAGDKWREYGRVYRLRQPGTLAVLTRWKGGPTTFDIEFGPERLSVEQDGQSLGTLQLDPNGWGFQGPLRIEWGKGVFGPLRGKIVERQVK